MTCLKRLITLFLVLCMLLVPISAAGRDLTEAESAAETLADLGVFKGSDSGYELDRAPTRLESLIMLLRLLGEEDEALSCTLPCLFTDVKDWAWCYVAYAYDQGYTSGSQVDPEKGVYLFDVGPASAEMYLTFVLRALGYGSADFRWDDPWPLAEAVGILPESVDRDKFLRADVALISLAALDAHLKDSGETLGGKLGLSLPRPTSPALTVVTAGSVSKFYARLNEALSRMPITLELHPTGDLSGLTFEEMLDLTLDCGFTWCQNATAYTYGAADGMTVEPDYLDAAMAWGYWCGLRTDTDSDAYRAAEPLMTRAAAVLTELGVANLSDYDKVRAIHDWLAENTRYDESYTGEHSHGAAGPLLEGSAVCDGYSAAFWLLCRMSGLNCIRVSGDTGGPHSWNKVQVDGAWYQVDLTWDDAIYYLNGVRTDKIFYDYFLVSDAVMAQDHVWIQHADMPAAPASYGG